MRKKVDRGTGEKRRGRMVPRIAACALGLALILPGIGLLPADLMAQAQAPAASNAVKLRTGEHPDYTRLVFDFPQVVEFNLNNDGGKLSLRFASPLPIDLGAVARRPPRWVSDLGVQADAGANIVRFTIPAVAKTKTWRDGGKIILDITGGDAKPEAAAASPAAAPPPPAAPRQSAAPATAPAPASPAAPPPAQPSPQRQAAAQPLSPVPAMPAASAPVQAPAAASAPASTLPPPGPPALPPGMAPSSGNPSAGVPASAPVQPVMAAGLDQMMPPPLNGPIGGEPMVPVVDSSRTGPLLIFPWTRPTAAAAFMRNGNLWLVFDRPARVDLRPITTRDWGGQLNNIEQLPVPNMTVLRLNVPSGSTATFARRNAGWTVSLNTAPPEQAAQREGTTSDSAPPPPAAERTASIDVRRMLDNDAGARLFFAANDPGAALQVPDPEIGDRIIVVPFAGPNGGVPEKRDFVELTVLPSFQGLAIEPHAGDLDVKRFPRGVEAVTQAGLSLSAPRGADPRRGAGEILDFDEWRKADGKDIVEQKQNLERRIAFAPNAGQRQQARLALAQFYFANDLQAEALGVLGKARLEQPELERDKRYRALRGIANLRLGRLTDAANDLESRIFDDDPDMLAYRGMLAVARDDWPSARKSFSLAGSAVAKFPSDIQAPIRLAMARAWLSGGDVAGAEAEIGALEPSAMRRGQLAEADYIRGLIYQAQNKPEDAIRSFDQASASGDRRARALAEYAKTEFMLSRKLIDNQQAIERFESLRFAWRGDPYEFNLLRRLGEMQFASGDLRSGIATFRQIVKYYPKSADVPLLTKQMSDEFARLFLDGGAQSMPPLAALALYYDFRELTPPGPEGDEIIGKLADRLVGVDLLNRAAELIEHQIQYRLRGEDRSRAGSRLAVVDLLDRKPEAALKALQNTDSPNLPAALVQERRLLQVRALADMDRFSEALNLIGNDQSSQAMGLRADIHWRAKDWTAAARVLSQMLGNRDADPAPLTADERKQLLQLGVALSLNNDIAGLEALRRKFEAKVKGTPDADAFNAVVSTIARGSGDPRELASTIAQIGQYEAFMSGYRDRVAKGGITAIN